MQRVLVDTNVLLSFLTDRVLSQRIRSREFFHRAEDGELAAILPQFVLFELAFVLRSVYDVPPRKISSDVGTIIDLPGTLILDECPWPIVLEIWPEKLDSLADAAIVAVAMANRYEQIATFDRRLARRLSQFGLESYW